MVVGSPTYTGCTLTGMKAISDYVDMKEEAIIFLIRNCGFPAKKTQGDKGVWISNKLAIDKWSFAFSMLSSPKFTE
jgi:lipoate-protein ligase B